ncbi:MAG: hypothetical protein QOF61_1140 [Acidobacteriota bacterium]|jgi:type II secretory pathway pseudopilin PulG|nr:hypothetical protein [Acidobacteriota bacterium]
MGSIRCNDCGFISFATAEQCKRCGNAFTTQQAGANHWQSHAAPQYAAYSDRTKKRAGLAIASLVIGLIGIPTLGILFVGAIVGLILGIVALSKSNSRPDEYGGRGLAIGGIVLNAVALLIVPVIGIIAAIAIPNLLASRRAANEGSAIASMRKLASAEYGYSNTAGDGKFADFNELVAHNMIEQPLIDGENNGYRFDVQTRGTDFEVTAVPVAYPNTGKRSFYYSSSDNFLRVADTKGGKIDDSATPLGELSEGSMSNQPGGSADGYAQQ